jgi:hypothetical protein
MSVSKAKDPVKVRAGLAGSRVRWGEGPRIVRIDKLSAEERRLVLALIDAAAAREASK